MAYLYGFCGETVSCLDHRNNVSLFKSSVHVFPGSIGVLILMPSSRVLVVIFSRVLRSWEGVGSTSCPLH